MSQYNYENYKREIIDKRQGKRATVDLSTRSLRRRVSRKETQPKKVRLRRILALATKNKDQIIVLNKENNILKGRQIEIEADVKKMKEQIDKWLKDENKL
ncbi:hypothetical protein LCGC14_2962620 [marine sediment metagenome]|uniref:Uncharacterized protein n=1 Tax=marine sediment metagenome TaxID=412755 RepID=A0A0F8XZ58_9ZZZZ